MNIYKDTIGAALGLIPLSQDQLAHINADVQQSMKKSSSLSHGGITWTKEVFPEHPFVGGEIQRKRVKDGTHHLLNSTTVIGPKGDIVIMPTEVYKNQTDYVSTQSDEGYIRRGLDPIKDRKTNLGKEMPLSDDAPQKLKGDDRTEAQKKASLEHSKKMKGKNLWPNGRILSEEHKNNLRKPRKSMSFKEYKCPHCDKKGRGNGMVRWHFDNCKTLNK